MSKHMLNMSVVAVLAAGAATASATASAAPIADALAIRNAAETDVVPVWGRGFWWGFGPAFVGGAIVGGAIATAPYYYGPYPYYYYGPPVAYGPGYPAPGSAAASCASRYKSYDPATGTFLGHDGQRHPCP
ncbi:MAG: BA14K family protein [Bradyrhizobiaceae bacterium]|nr:BA14K family protein [Bradyrhizobiaceae bacterium]